MKKGITVLLVACMMLAGCGGKNNDEKSSQSEAYSTESSSSSIKTFEVDTTELELQGYENIAGLAYINITDSTEKPIINIVYTMDMPEESFYILTKVVRYFTSTDFRDTQIIFSWEGKEYDFDDTDGMETADELIEFMPDSWENVSEEVFKNSTEIGSLITKQNADLIDEDLDPFLSDYTENGPTEIIASEIYEITGGNLTLSLSKSDGKMTYKIDATADSEERAFLIFGAFAVEIDELEDEFYECVLNIRYDDLTFLYQRIGGMNIISGINRDGSVVMEMPDWIDKDMDNLNMSEDDMDIFFAEIENTAYDFGKQAGYKMGYLLDN